MAGAGTEDDPAFFETPAKFRAWLKREHHRRDVAWIGFHRVSASTPSITWNDSVDVALSFGWIDGVRKGIDATRYKMRFTPRRPGSIWSAKNARRMRELIEEGVVAPAGLAAFAARREDRTGVYSFDRTTAVELPTEYEAELRKHREASKFWDAQPPGYRRTATHWVTSARREETRRKRLAQLIQDSADGVRIGLLRR